MTRRTLPILAILACLALAACSTVRDGVIVRKRFRIEEPEVYDLYEFSFRCEPSVYWVQVQGQDARGRVRTRDIIVFRHDWDQLRVGDHWSKKNGFSPAAGEK